MKINPTHFNEVEINEKDIILLERGLIGLPELKRFVLMDFDDGLAFHWLQSIDRPDIGFLVSDPNLFSENYSLVIDYDMKEQLRFEKNDEMVVMIIVTVKDRGKTITGNLLGPIVVNATKRLGCQATSGTSECDTAAPLRSNERVGTESDNKKAGVTV